MLRVLFLVLITGMLCLQAWAVNPDEVLSDPVLENRARELSSEIRCLVCQNQSIDDSDAQLARDLRVLVRQQLVEGKSDSEILDFLVERYGEFILLKPSFTAKNMALWLLPIIALLAGVLSVRSLFKSRSKAQDESEITPLTAKEKTELSKILDRR